MTGSQLLFMVPMSSLVSQDSVGGWLNVSPPLGSRD
jgi:hypothetical protein